MLFRSVPDGDDVGEQHDEPEQVPEPGSHEALQGDHHHGQQHLGQEQGLGEPVQLQVQQAHLQGESLVVRAFDFILRGTSTPFPMLCVVLANSVC